MTDNLLLIGSGSGDAMLWKIGQGRAWVTPLKAEVHSIECAFKNPLFIAGCVNGVLHFGNCETGKVIFEMPAH